MTEEPQPQEQPQPQKYVVFIQAPDGKVLIKLEGVDMDTARKIVSVGHLNFEREYELFLRRTV